MVDIGSIVNMQLCVDCFLFRMAMQDTLKGRHSEHNADVLIRDEASSPGDTEVTRYTYYSSPKSFNLHFVTCITST